MTILEEVVFLILTTLSSFSPISNLDENDFMSPLTYPHVYVIPEADFQMAACGCPCGLSGAYLGRVRIDDFMAYTIVMSGIERDEEVLVPYKNPFWKSILFHETVHYRSDVKGELEYVNGLSDEDMRVKRIEYENEAYILQNGYNALNGMPLLNVDEATDHSIAQADNTNYCYPGYEPIPEEDRPNMLTLIEFYDDGMIDIYKKKYH